jgi:hypothetical protein
MRYLNRIIFINSANIRYAEVNLKGNVHFIGTQGVGKSTLLRAVLFFYNADTLGLGIPRQKLSYVDYYFKNDNAYIIYEVVRGESTFCIVSYKSQHKVCFRIFDSAYRREFFVSENGNVPESWEGIATALDAHRVYYTKRKIDEYKAYRDIIYSNVNAKRSELKRYSILESKDYQYIPKTIQNVFLNSKMEAEFIKQTIIMSLDNDVSIDLNQYAHHLNGFETQLGDIKKFRTPSATAQAQNIAKLFVAIKALERDKIKLAKQLAWAAQQCQIQEPLIAESLEQRRENLVAIEDKIESISYNFKERRDRLKGDIRIQSDKLLKARNLVKEYEVKNIEEVLLRVSKKDDFANEQERLQNEKSLLLAKFASIDEKYKALENTLNNQLQQFTNEKNAQKNKAESAFQDFASQIGSQYENIITDLRQEHKTDIEELRQQWELKKDAVHTIKNKKSELKHKRFYEAELQQVQSDIAQNKEQERSLTAQLKSVEIEQQNLQKQWALDQQSLESKLENQKEKHNEQIAKAQAKANEIDDYLSKMEGALFGWLNKNYPNWQDSIGKVIDEKNVLFNTNLSPKLLAQSQSVFGVELNLSEIDKKVKTAKDYQKEQDDFNRQIAELNEQMHQLDAQHEKDLENLKRRFQPKIRGLKDQSRKDAYELEQIAEKLKQLVLSENEIITKAKDEKEREKAKLEIQLEEAITQELEAKASINQAEEKLEKQIKTKEQERNKKLKAEKENLQLVLDELNQIIENEQKSTAKRIEALSKEKLSELKNKGADTRRIRVIDNRLNAVNTELRFIDQNRDLVANYNKDKTEYINKVEDFKLEKRKLEKHLARTTERHHTELEKYRKELNEINAQIEQLQKQLDQITEDLEAFNQFCERQFYQSIAEYFTKPSSDFSTDKRPKYLIDELNDLVFQKLQNRSEELKKTTTEFLGKFSDDNLFKFKKNLSDNQTYMEFALMLTDFVEENKIEQIEREVNERFAWLVSTLTKQTNQLLSNAGSIQQVVKRINRDFEEKNFTGVIKKIELKVDDTKNEVVLLLRLIKTFNDENAMDLGSVNLFSSNDHEKQSKRAVDLLKQFVRKIAELKRDKIVLADAFELKFRVLENDNDSGWVEKLSNVGSEGTDVLVKAMLNIMLLNVFKEGASRRFKDFELHCMMDEIGKLHPNNVRGILNFAKDRNIHLISGSPIENDALAFDHIYKLHKDKKSITHVKRIISKYA